jgi:hypothetical protein
MCMCICIYVFGRNTQIHTHKHTMHTNRNTQACIHPPCVGFPSRYVPSYSHLQPNYSQKKKFTAKLQPKKKVSLSICTLLLKFTAKLQPKKKVYSQITAKKKSFPLDMYPLTQIYSQIISMTQYFIYTYTHTHTHTYIHTYKNIPPSCIDLASSMCTFLFTFAAKSSLLRSKPSYIHTYIHIYIYIYIYIHTYINIPPSCVDFSSSICTFLFTFAAKSSLLRSTQVTSLCLHTYIHTYIHIYIHIYIHTKPYLHHVSISLAH